MLVGEELTKLKDELSVVKSEMARLEAQNLATGAAIGVLLKSMSIVNKGLTDEVMRVLRDNANQPNKPKGFVESVEHIIKAYDLIDVA
ncbi:hypothetical protein [Aeromonas veronii]|uniref:Uncharacterized protein n=1 Tax=Aeromonas veronii AMC34 TaxID=1073383 RepID=K1IG78_AERVE|nr:hypothetical protein [Aeromonas veronii]EKB17196.1 hypothetical protein HMPREF1168_03423 [Aeromonas veronii AMC34]